MTLSNGAAGLAKPPGSQQQNLCQSAEPNACQGGASTAAVLAVLERAENEVEAFLAGAAKQAEQDGKHGITTKRFNQCVDFGQAGRALLSAAAAFAIRTP
eukprot:3689384-Rhodomonas_salina.3